MSHEETFISLFTACEPAIRTFIRAIVRDAEAEEEIFQETAVVLWEKYAEAVRDLQTFRRLIFTTAKYKILSWKRNQARERITFDETAIELLAQTAFETQETVSRRQILLNEAVKCLSSEEKKLLFDSCSKETKIKEIAENQGATPMALYKKIQRIRQKLLDYVRNHEVNGEDS